MYSYPQCNGKYTGFLGNPNTYVDHSCNKLSKEKASDFKNHQFLTVLEVLCKQRLMLKRSLTSRNISKIPTTNNQT